MHTKHLVVAMTALSLFSGAFAQAPQVKASGARQMKSVADVGAVAPALEHYTQVRLLGEVWKRPDLSPRDRSIVTAAALIARNQTTEMPYYFNLALDNGVKPGELSELITHLAFYSGWGNAMAAVTVAKDIFGKRKIRSEDLPAAMPKLLPLNEAAETQRVTTVEKQFGNVAPGVVQYTTDVLFRDLWLRPDLAPRDKISYLPRKLSRDGAPAGTKSKAGDIAYYTPWGNLAIFYKDSGYADGLIKLGTIDAGLEAFLASGSARVRIEPVTDQHAITKQIL